MCKCVWMCVGCSVVSNSLWPHGHSPQGSPVHGILQATILEWVAISFSRNLPDSGIELGSPQTLYHLIHQGSPKKQKEKKNKTHWFDLFFFFTYKEYVARSRQSVNPWWINEWMTTFDICPGGSMRGCKKSELWNQTTWVWGSEILILVAGRA